VLKGQRATINWAALGYTVEVSLRITLDKTEPRAFDEFLAAAREVPEVIEIQTFLGRVDARLAVIARTHGALSGHLPRPYPDPAAYRRYRGADAGLHDQGQADASAMSLDLDDTDRAILRALQADATLKASDLGQRIGLSQPATWRRIKRLTEAGVIGQRRLDLDLEALGFGVTVFLGVKLATKGRVSLEDFERAVSAIPEVQTVEHVLGLYDYRLRVVARDLPDFERVLRRRIMTLPGCGGVEANVVLSEERRPGPIG
jgi:Lrp/AsnC family leucine-responsive transcriptional regulator